MRFICTEYGAMYSFFSLKDCIYLFDREKDHRQAEREGEADSPPSREPDAGLDPRKI